MKTWKKWLLYIGCFVSYTCTYIVRINLSMAAPGLREAGALTGGQIGALGSIFSVMYALGRILNGSLCDRIRPRYMMAAGLCTAGLCNLIVGTLPPFAGMLVLWGANAFALSMLWGAVQTVIFALYQGEEGRIKMSLMSSAVAMGNIVSILLTAYLVKHYSVAMAFVVPGAMVILVGITDLFAYRGVSFYFSEEEKPDSSGVKSIAGLIRRGGVRRVMASAFSHGVMKECIGLWMALIFVDIYGLDLNKSAVSIVLIPLIGFAGRLSFPALYKVCGSDEMKAGRLAFALSAVCGVLLCFKALGVIVGLLAISLMYAAISMINVALLAIYPSRFIEDHSMNTLAGILDTSTYAGSALLSVVYGYVVAHWGYVPMFISWAGFSLLGLWMLPRREK